MDTAYNSYMYVDLDGLRENLRAIIARNGSARLIPVLKSDAFGLGLAPVGKAAAELPEIDCLAAAHVSEGLELRAAGVAKDVLIIGSALPRQMPAAVAAGLTLTAGRPGFLTELDAAASAAGLDARVQLKLDTGLHRIGVEPGEELAALIGELKGARRLRLTGVFSHFSDTDDAALTQAQYLTYMRGIDQLTAAGVDPVRRHIACSAANELYPQYTLDAVRIGRGLFMDHPVKPLGTIREIASWRTAVTFIKQRRAGDVLGYGGAVHLERDALIASIGVGYGDGLNKRLAAVGAPVLVNGRRCPLLYCSMDQSLVDVTGAGCAVGDEATLFGYSSKGDYLSSQELAQLIGEEGCALTAALSKRVARVY